MPRPHLTSRCRVPWISLSRNRADAKIVRRLLSISRPVLTLKPIASQLLHLLLSNWHGQHSVVNSICPGQRKRKERRTECSGRLRCRGCFRRRRGWEIGCPLRCFLSTQRPSLWSLGGKRGRETELGFPSPTSLPHPFHEQKQAKEKRTGQRVGTVKSVSIPVSGLLHKLSDSFCCSLSSA